jgi:ubiquinone/menaquinone biosynthesis C-methylase UbiE
MSKLQLYAKVARLFLGKKIVSAEDIGKSYSRVSALYKATFLTAMHAYNDAMILELSRHLDPNRNWKVLDLAAGTGYNSIALSQMLPAAGFTLVDISAGMLDEARKSLGENASFVTDDMLHYLENCAANTFDVVVCGWAIKYRPPLQIIKQCQRVLRQDGYLAVIVNTKDTLPQVARIYPQLLAKHTGNISRLMLRQSQKCSRL